MLSYFKYISLSQRILMSSLFFALPSIVLLFLVNNEIGHDIQFAEREIAGIKVLQPLNRLLIQLPQYAFLQASILADKSQIIQKQYFQTKQDEIQATLAQLDKIVQTYETILKLDSTALQFSSLTQSAPAALAKQWLYIGQTALLDDNLEALIQFIQNIRALIRYVGNHSNLILDPDLDSYYLMDIVVLQMSQLQYSHMDLLMQTHQFKQGNAFSLVQKSRLDRLINQFTHYKAALVNALGTALSENINFVSRNGDLQTHLPPAMKTYIEYFDRLVITLESTYHQEFSVEQLLAVEQASQQVLQQAHSLTDLIEKELENLLLIRIDAFKTRILYYLAFSLLVLLLAGLMTHITLKEVMRNLKTVVKVVEEIAQGNLGVTFENTKQDRQDEVGQLMRSISKMLENLNLLIGKMQCSSNKVSSSATTLVSTTQQHEMMMDSQFESSRNTLHAVEEVAQLSTQLVNTMHSVSNMSNNTSQIATDSQEDLLTMEKAMLQMEASSKVISQRLEVIYEQAKGITGVVTTITKVSDQTNLLSLNAAIEAEKAGQYGLGFTVVAREIRRLADQTAVATLSISQMVKDMQTAVSAGVMEMDKFISGVQSNVHEVGKIGTQLNNVISHVQNLEPEYQAVNESIHQQSQHMQSIHQSVNQLSEEMQQTVDGLQTSHAEINQLNDAAQDLQIESMKFTVKQN